MWNWLGNLSQGQASFLGSLVGAFVGLFALLLGALFNAHLTRKRDDRLRAEERRSVATALRAELAKCRDALLRNSEKLREPTTGFFLVADLAHAIQIWPHMIPKLGLFDQETIARVTDAYLAVEQYCDMLLLSGGRLIDPKRLIHPESIAISEAGEASEAEKTRSTNGRLISLSADKAPRVIQIHSAVSEAIESAIVQLDTSLRIKRWWWPWLERR
jgi:hypothetical protein